MRVDEDVIRYLTVKVDALEEGPSAMLSQKNHKNYDEFEFDMNASEGEVDNG
jgi:ribosomal protein S6